MNNKRIVNALAALILPGLDRLDQKCNRIISELSELKSTLRHSERNIDTLIDKLENSASLLRRLLRCVKNKLTAAVTRSIHSKESE